MILNDTTVSKLSGANISDSFLNTNNVYQYEYENINSNLSSDKTVYFI